MTIDLDKMREEVKEIMELRGLAIQDVADALDSKPSKSTLFGWLNGSSSGAELVADLAKWMGKSLREFETWHPKPGARSPYLPPLTCLSRLQSLLKEARISPKMAKLLMDLVELEAKEGLERVRKDFAKRV